MEIRKTPVLESSDSLSKALAQLDTQPAVIITKNGRYIGIIDHRSLTQGIRDPQNVKCESATIKPPLLNEGSTIVERMDAFLLGHFKALPVCDEDEKPIGITTRVELLKEMAKANLIPQMSVSELMSSPVYTIDEDATIGSVRTALKENSARRLVVMRKSNLIGVISNFDIGSWTAPNLLLSGRKDIRSGEQISMDSIKISGILRPDVTLVDEEATVQDAARRMVEKSVSAVIVVADRKPLGVLAAIDIFKKVKDLMQEGIQIQISGLDEDSMSHYAHIRAKIGHILDKFGKSFEIRNCSVHVKEGKSTFVVSIYFDMEKGHVALKTEKDSLVESVDELASELNNVLRKRKEIRKVKPRVTHAR
ncbi:MAG: CBS domain-containing protein [Candidatus Micrarchaeia archaeon]